MRKQAAHRKGAILFLVLACLGVSTAIVMVSIRSSLRIRRQMRQELQMEQTRWLLDAGVAHAKARLNSEPEYDGEIWQPDQGLGAYAEASVEIVVSTDDVPSDRVRVTVKAQLRGDETLSKPTTRSRTSIVQRNETTSNTP